MNRRLWLSCAALPLMAACASPREHLYSLANPEPGETRQRTVPTIELGPVGVPELMDRPQLVLKDSEFTVTINEQERWAAPLKEQLQRVLAANLDAQTPNYRFVPASSAAIGSPIARLSVEVSRLELIRGVGVNLVTHWLYRPLSEQKPPMEGDARVSVPLRLAGYPGFIEALNRACIDAAGQIGQELAQLPTPAD